MLIYEKNNKLNMNFDPSKSIEDNPDIVIGENEISVSGNNIVNGGGGSAPLIVTDTDGTLDKTWQEIETAFLSGTNIIICHTDTGKSTTIGKYLVVSVYEVVDTLNPYQVLCLGRYGSGSIPYSCSAKSDYPESPTLT